MKGLSIYPMTSQHIFNMPIIDYETRWGYWVRTISQFESESYSA